MATPPNFHKTKSLTRNCHMCVFVNRTSGRCTKYDVPVERDDVCSRFEPRPRSQGQLP